MPSGWPESAVLETLSKRSRGAGHEAAHAPNGWSASGSVALLVDVTVDRRDESTVMPVVITYFSSIASWSTGPPSACGRNHPPWRRDLERAPSPRRVFAIRGLPDAERVRRAVTERLWEGVLGAGVGGSSHPRLWELLAKVREHATVSD
jgi:hypothetical protein